MKKQKKLKIGFFMSIFILIQFTLFMQPLHGGVNDIEFTFERDDLFDESNLILNYSRNANLINGQYFALYDDFAFEYYNKLYDIGADNIGYWLDVENGFDHTNIIEDPLDALDRCIEFQGLGASGEVTGIENDWFTTTKLEFNVSLLFVTDSISSSSTTGNYFIHLYSSDSTLFSTLRFRVQSVYYPNFILQIYNGTEYVILRNDLNIYDEIRLDILCNHSSSDMVVSIYENNTHGGTFMESMITSGKNGLYEVEFLMDVALLAGQNWITHLDYFTVLDLETQLPIPAGLQLAGVMSYTVNITRPWDLVFYHDLIYNASGIYSMWLMNDTYDVTSIEIMHDWVYDPEVKEFQITLDHNNFDFDEYQNATIVFIFTENFTLNAISCASSYMLSQGVSYPLETERMGWYVYANQTYFYCDVEGYLNYEFYVNTSFPRWIVCSFDIPNYDTDNYAVRFSGIREGSPACDFEVNYTNGYYSEYSISKSYDYFYRRLPTDMTISHFRFNVSCYDLLDSDGRGYFSTITLVYLPDSGVTFATTEFMVAMITFAIDILVTYFISGIFGTWRRKKLFIPIFLFFSFILWAGDLLPLPLLFIIIVSSIFILAVQSRSERWF